MKPVLVHYIDVGNLETADIPTYMNQIVQTCTYDGEYHAIFLPVRNQDSRVECLNPTVILSKGKERNKIINNLNKLKFDVSEMIRRAPYMSKNQLLTERIEKI